MQIDLTNILLQPGITEAFEGILSLSSVQMNGESFQIVEQSPLLVSVTHREKQILEVDVHCEIGLAIPCARCLEVVVVPLVLQVNQEIDLKARSEEQIESLEVRDCMEGKVLDADKLVYHELIISWPLQVLCKENCKGICPDCGVNRNQTSCDCDTVVLDPRMAAIRDIFSKFKEEV
jgi:uncharacterized protein